MIKTIKLKITTPERVVLEKDVEQVTLPTELGEITILPKHVPLLSNIVPGVIEIQDNGKSFPMAISGGFLEFHNDEVTILADTAERAEEIDLERAEKARRQAEDMKSEKRKHFDEGQYAAVVSNLERQMARIRVAKKYRPRGASSLHRSNK